MATLRRTLAEILQQGSVDSDGRLSIGAQVMPPMCRAMHARTCAVSCRTGALLCTTCGGVPEATADTTASTLCSGCVPHALGRTPGLQAACSGAWHPDAVAVQFAQQMQRLRNTVVCSTIEVCVSHSITACCVISSPKPPCLLSNTHGCVQAAGLPACQLNVHQHCPGLFCAAGVGGVLPGGLHAQRLPRQR